jgi:hypothetical protein
MGGDLMSKKMLTNIVAVICCLLMGANTPAQVFELTQTAIAGGGASTGTGGDYSLSSTTGQAAAGNALRRSPYSMTVGFWNPDTLPPTAATVSITGRVTTVGGAGIRNVNLVLAGGALGGPRYAQTGSFGYYRFDDVPVGATYILTAYAARYFIAQPSLTINLMDEFTEGNFIGEPFSR